MPPYTTVTTLPVEEVPQKKEQYLQLPVDHTYRTLWGRFQTPLIWPNIIGIFALHIIAIVGVLKLHPVEHKLIIIWGSICAWTGGFGVTAGAHRFWCHKAYKAKLPLKIILVICYAAAGQNRMIDWVRDHRVHHKFSETDADPHNANRGFFFSHVGWLMMRKHPEVLRRGRQLDYSDLLEDPVVVFFEKYFWPMKLFWCFIVPASVPYFLFNETLGWSIMCSIIKYVFGLNFTWSVNSAAHIFGNKPYDKRIQPAENLAVSIMAMGEGWHNYHHSFPWDYKAAELGNYTFNVTTMFLDFFAKIGWAYDLKTPSPDLVQKMINKYGDGTHEHIEEVPMEAN